MDDDNGPSTERASLFVYLNTEYANDYRAIMNLFAGPLLVDLSASEVAHQFSERGFSLSADEATTHCEQLVDGAIWYVERSATEAADGAARMSGSPVRVISPAAGTPFVDLGLLLAQSQVVAVARVEPGVIGEDVEQAGLHVVQ